MEKRDRCDRERLNWDQKRFASDRKRYRIRETEKVTYWSSVERKFDPLGKRRGE